MAPAESTTYTITATNHLGGEVIETVDVIVLPLPTVDLTVSPSEILLGNQATLTWMSTDADICTIDPDVGEVPISGSVSVSPDTTTTYTITATNPGGEAITGVEVVVVPFPVVTLSASPNTINEGETATLEWTSSNGLSAVISDGVGAVPMNGSIQVTPDQTTSYAITVTGDGGITTSTATVTVQHLEPVVSIASDTHTIFLGEPATLSWSSAHGHTCEILPDIGIVDPSGAVVVSPSETTTYTITVSNPDYSATASLTINVNREVDIQPTSIDMTNTSVDGQTLNLSGDVSVAVVNNGADALDEMFSITLFEDMDFNEAYDEGIDSVIGREAVTAFLGSGETAMFSIEVDADILFKGNLVFAYVDSENRIAESNEDNNIINSMATCEYIPPVGSFDPVLEWEWRGSTIKPESNQVVMTPIVANLNDDNSDGQVNTSDIPDIIFISHVGRECRYDGTLRAISGDGSGELFSVVDYETLPDSCPAVGDIDNDGLVEIVVIGEYLNPEKNQVRIYAFENDGTLKWSSDILAFPRLTGHAVTIADLNSDGSPELIIGNLVLNSDGTLKWIGTGGSIGRNHSVAVDLDLDGTSELVAGNTAYDHDGNILWENAAIGNAFSAVANFDEDPFPEIVSVGAGYIFLLEHTGEIIWGPKDIPPTGINEDYGGAPTVADFDNDGQPEIGVAGGDWYVVLESDGSLLWASNIEDSSSSHTSSSVFDFEGDGSAEVVYADEEYLRIYRGTDGTILFRERLGSRTRTENPIIVDVDNDNNAEIVVTSNNALWGVKNGVQIFGDANDTWVNTRKIWNQHVYSITNVNDDGSIPVHPANNWEIFNNFRQNQMLNPFGCVDLTASDIRIDNTGYPGSVDLVVKIGNGGAIHTPPGIEVSFYQGDPQAGGVLLSTRTISDRIDPGAFTDVAATWSNPPVGLENIYVVADDNGSGKGKVNEVDEENNMASAYFSLGNYTPVARAGDDQIVVEGDTVSVDGSQSHDPEGDPITFQWSIIQQPDGSMAQLTDAFAEQTGFTADLPGVYYLQLVVHDGTIGSYIDMLTVTAKALVPVQDMAGYSRTAAEALIRDNGLAVGSIDEAYSDTVTAGYVISQTPQAGAVIPEGSPVSLTVSKGVHMVTVPDLFGRTQTEAEAALVAEVLGVGDISEEYIDILPAGLVLRQSPSSGASVMHDTPVAMTVSLGAWTGEDTTPPAVSIEVLPDRLTIGETAYITIMATDNVGVVNRSLTINGLPLQLTGNQAAYVTDASGIFTAEVTATDAAGFSTSARARFYVADPNDTTPPVVLLDDTVCADVTDLHVVTGSVSDEVGTDYTLSYRRQGTLEWIPFSGGSVTDLNGELGIFDPTLLKNGVYEIAVFAKDFSGNTAEAVGCVVVDGEMKLGQVTLPIQDFVIPSPGFDLSVNRVYDSRSTEPGDFGPGWHLASSEVEAQVTQSLGEGWKENTVSGTLTTYVLAEQHRHVVVIRFSDEETLKFQLDVNPKTSLGFPLSTVNFSATFLPLDDTQGTLEALDVESDSLMYVFGKLRVFGTDPYEPTRFRYTRADGTAYVIGQSGIESVTDAYGNTVAYDNDGIHHSSGASLSFERNAGNRIEKIVDPVGNEFEYHYDEEGNLEQVYQKKSAVMGLVNEYIYDHYLPGSRPVLKDIKAPDGTTLGQFEYDADGRMTALIDADGNRIVYGYDLPSHKQEITDRRGNITLYEYDGNGNVTRKLDPLGNETLWTYDANNHKLTETNALGQTTGFAHDKYGNLLTETDPLGNTTTNTYNDKNDVLTFTDALGHVTVYTYDDNGNLLTMTDPVHGQMVNTYNDNGLLKTMTDAAGHTTSYTYDAAGNVASETDASGHVRTYTHDAYGNQLSESTTRITASGPVTLTTFYEYDGFHRKIKETDVDGYFVEMEYNDQGKVTRRQDKNGAVTTFEYDPNGNQTLIAFADNTTEAYTYDEDGNKLTFTDRDGHTTTYGYDELNRLVSTTYADGSVSVSEYDAAGRVVVATDENGHVTAFEYDAAGRRTRIVDALGHETLFAYDAAGNQTSVTDANGHVTTYAYDDASRLVQTTYHDGTFTTVGYDAAGRKISETDQNGNTTAYAYDAMGRLTAVTDALNAETRYEYDETGNKISQIDPNNHVTTWDYDNQGRVTTHTLPLGMFETFTYDPVGNMLSKTDFNGDTTTYDYSICCGRLTRKAYADGSEVVYTYTGTGRQATVTDDRGTTYYSYDARNRLIHVENPDGTPLAYTYDPAGNRLSVTVPSGRSDYAFDGVNRLETVTDPDGAVTAYTYDNVGNRATVAYPNGTVTAYAYDALNRLTDLTNIRSDNQVISGYTYTLGPAGNRIRVAEADGRIVDYTYDAVYKLVAEEITDAVNGNQTITYTYDAFGNRLTKTDPSGTVTYTYDNNDRLITEAGPDGTQTYAYDDNGNTISKTDATETTLYSYDYENHLILVDTATTDTLYDYDADGIRVSSETDGSVTDFLVDKNRDYAQVLEERDTTGAIIVEYIYGDDLISQERGGADYCYLYDGQMSTRQLIDENEDVANTYTYDAFGMVIDQAGVVANHYMYTGEQYDPNAGFYYLRARWMNPETGRLITTDPFEGVQNDPVTLHKYLYVQNNPVIMVDPSGEFTASLSEIGTVVGLSYAITSIALPNLARLKSYAGRTDRFEIHIAGGGELGYLSYFSLFNAFIVERNPSSGTLQYPRKRGLFHVTLIGFGAGIGAVLPSSGPQKFPTNRGRNIEYFDGIGRISSVGASSYLYGGSCGEMQMAEGTSIPFNCSLGHSLSFKRFGASGFVALAYWDLVRIDNI